jgi:hypothetical protein
MSNNILKNALAYQKRNLSVIPVKPDKKPLIKWEEYKKRIADPDEIRVWFKKWPHANIGIVTGKISGDVGVIDVDNETGIEEINELLPESYITPMADTPSGGEHIYTVIPDGLSLSNNVRIIPGCDFRGEGGYVVAPPSKIEAGCYRWKQGLSIDDVAIAETPAAYIDRLTAASRYLNNKKHCIKRVCRQDVDSTLKMFVKGRRDEDLFHIVNALVKGGLPDEEILQVAEILAKNCQPLFDEKELTVFLDSVLKRAATRERSLSQEVRDWACLQSGYILSTDIYNCLQLSTREDKKNVHIILRRMCDEGLLERHGDRSGCYRVIDTAVDEIDYQNSTTEYLDIKFPFREEQYVRLMAKNIAIIAGTPDAGKTAYLLNFAKLNMDKFDVYYFSSEMGAKELRGRMEKFDCPIERWKVKAYERSASFSDVIKPDAVNIIDYLEISKDFYLVADLIKGIFNKLRNGIAFIAIQKDFGAQFGRGKSFGMEKARLYLSIEKHTLKMVKAKNWVNSFINPNDMELEFKLHRGCEFEVIRDWHKTNE